MRSNSSSWRRWGVGGLALAVAAMHIARAPLQALSTEVQQRERATASAAGASLATHRSSPVPRVPQPTAPLVTHIDYSVTQDPGEQWFESFPEGQRATPDPESVLHMLRREVARLYPKEEERITTHPDGRKTIDDADIDADVMEPQAPIYVESHGDSRDPFDHVVVAFEDREMQDIGLIVTCLMRGDVVVPAAYATYPRGRRPPRYPFASSDEVRSIAAKMGMALQGDPIPVFFRSPVSPTPMLFVYELVTTSDVVYVSQDGAVWRELEDMLGPF